MLGTGLATGFSLETSWGTPSGSVDNYAWSFAGMENIQSDVTQIGGESLVDRTMRDDQIAAGSRQAAGPYGFDCQFGGGWLMFPSLLTGEDPITTGAGPYTHVLHLGAALGGGGGGTTNLAEGITIFIDKTGQAAGAGEKAFSYMGGKPKGIEFSYAQDARLRMSSDMWFRDFSAFGAQFTPTLPARSWIIAPSQAAAPTDFLLYNGVAYRCTVASIKLEQEWEGLGDLQDPTANAQAIGGGFKVSVSVTIEAPDTGTTTGGAFWDDYRTKTTRPVVITSEGPTAAAESLIWNLHSCQVVNAQDPQVSGPGTVRISVELEAYFDSANSEVGTLTLLSADATAWA